MAFVGRRGDNSIYGTWTVRQWAGQEELPDTHPDVVAFLVPPPRPDLSNVDSLDRSVRVLALCIAQVGGLTGPQMKALFRQKWDALP